MEFEQLIQVIGEQAPIVIVLVVVLWKRSQEAQRLLDLLSAARENHISDLRRLIDDMSSLVAALSGRKRSDDDPPV